MSIQKRILFVDNHIKISALTKLISDYLSCFTYYINDQYDHNRDPKDYDSHEILIDEQYFDSIKIIDRHNNDNHNKIRMGSHQTSPDTFISSMKKLINDKFATIMFDDDNLPNSSLIALNMFHLNQIVLLTLNTTSSDVCVGTYCIDRDGDVNNSYFWQYFYLHSGRDYYENYLPHPVVSSHIIYLFNTYDLSYHYVSLLFENSNWIKMSGPLLINTPNFLDYDVNDCRMTGFLGSVIIEDKYIFFVCACDIYVLNLQTDSWKNLEISFIPSIGYKYTKFFYDSQNHQILAFDPHGGNVFKLHIDSEIGQNLDSNWKYLGFVHLRNCGCNDENCRNRNKNNHKQNNDWNEINSHNNKLLYFYDHNYGAEEEEEKVDDIENNVVNKWWHRSRIGKSWFNGQDHEFYIGYDFTNKSESEFESESATSSASASIIDIPLCYNGLPDIYHFSVSSS